jgi:hypothetical protein
VNRRRRAFVVVVLIIAGTGFVVAATTVGPCPPAKYCVFTHSSMRALLAMACVGAVLVAHLVAPSRTPRPTADGILIGDRLVPWWTVSTARWVRRSRYGEIVVLRVSKAGRPDNVWLPRSGTLLLYPSDYGMPAQALIGWLAQLAEPHDIVVLAPLERGAAR